MQCEYYALEGLSDLVQTIRKVRALNPRLEVEDCCAQCMTAQYTALNVSADLQKHFAREGIERSFRATSASRKRRASHSALP
jgi:chromosome partitioning protein